MSGTTKIEWCDATFNPWIGCMRVSPACDHCYAEAMMRRFGHAELWQGERRRTSETNWREPFRWDRAAKRAGERRRVFCASLADVFDNQVPDIWRSDLFAVIEDTPNLDWLLLTKRPQNVATMIWPKWDAALPANIWLGTTVENQEEADRRIPHLLSVPAAVRFLSCEPLLGPVDLHSKLCRETGSCQSCPQCLGGIGWAIVGGESGHGARPMHPEWARSLRDQCTRAGVPFFFKQWGQWHPDALLLRDMEGRSPPPNMKIGKKRAGRLLDGRTHDEFPR